MNQATQGVESTRHSGKDGNANFYGGDAAGFIVAADNAPVLYHAGDTSFFSDTPVGLEQKGCSR